MRYLKTFEKASSEDSTEQKNYISDIFYSLQAYQVNYLYFHKGSYYNQGHFETGYIIVFNYQNTQVNKIMSMELVESIEHFKNFDLAIDINQLRNLLRRELF